MALFELIQFSVVMRSLQTVSFLSIFAIRIPNYILNFPSMFLKLITGLIAFIGGKISFTDMLARAFKDHYKEAIRDASDLANRHIAVTIFEWLEKHPLPETGRRFLVFGAFAILSLCDLFTS